MPNSLGAYEASGLVSEGLDAATSTQDSRFLVWLACFVVAAEWETRQVTAHLTTCEDGSRVAYVGTEDLVPYNQDAYAR